MLKANAAAKLVEARARLGLSRLDLERKTRDNGFRVTEGTIFNIEKGVSKKPYLRSIYALCTALELDPSEIVETEEAVGA